MKAITGGRGLARPVSNYVMKKKKGPNGKDVEFKSPIEPRDIADNIFRLTGGFPKRVAQELFAIINGSEVSWITEPGRLFGYLRSFGMPCFWSTSEGMITKREFCEYLKQNAENFEGVSKLPHFPPLKELFYALPTKAKTAQAKNNGSALDDLLAFFNPATPEDRSLINAAFITPFWGGPYGGRPAFLIEGDEGNGRGYGKTSLVQAIIRLSGGEVDVALNDGEDIKKAIINDQSGGRVLLLDNVKANRLSSSSLEKTLTSHNIVGHRMYVGTVRVLNHLTFLITVNDANCSSDMAQRCIPVRIKKANYDGTWTDRLNDFIDRNKWELIREIGEVLSKPSLPPKEFLRFAKWHQEVLHRIDPSSNIVELILQRQNAVNDDSEDSEDLIDHFASMISRYSVPSGSYAAKPIDPEKTPVLIKKSIAAQWYANHIGQNSVSCRSATIQLRRRIPWLKEHRLNNARCLFWSMPAPDHVVVDDSRVQGGWLIHDFNTNNWLSFQKFSDATSVSK